MEHIKSLAGHFKRIRMLYLLILPAVLYFIIFTYFPVLNGFRISFQDYRFIGASKFVGLKNYIEAIHTPGFWRVFGNTLILGLSNVILTAFIPMFLALLLNEVQFTPWKRFSQTIIYMPHLFSWVIVGGIWIFILSPNSGLINILRSFFGKPSIYFMAKESYARTIMIGVNLWKQSGYVCILYLASIAGINTELYEAAMIDGAGSFKRALYITVPELVSTLKVVLLLNVMGALRIFNQIYVMRNEVIAPKIDVLMYYVYDRGLAQFKLGYASAISVIVFVITMIITIISLKLIKYKI
ncbi:MAG: sugar ABC transporter permease [Spirochaetes bacterium]|nr:MAG: sugar ABC transporter permease [Spirochaetota bacterium]